MSGAVRVKVRGIVLYPDDWLSGTLALSLEEQGAYWRLCCLIYSQGRPMPDDDVFLSRMMGINTQRWKRLKIRLSDTQKITVRDGKIHQPRCDMEMERMAAKVEAWTTAGRIGGQKSAAARAATEESLKNLSTSRELAPNFSKDRNANALTNNGVDPSHHQRPVNLPILSSLLLRSKGADAPPPIDNQAAKNTTEITPSAVIFGKEPGGCLAYLIAAGEKEPHARSFLADKRAKHGDGKVIEAVALAQQKGVSEPKSFITKTLNVRHPVNGGGFDWERI